MKDSHEFKYINAFVNTIKHRRLLETEYVAEFGMGTRNDDGIQIKAFSYKGDSFPPIWAKDIVGDYQSRILEHIYAIGNAVNDYLR